MKHALEETTKIAQELALEHGLSTISKEREVHAGKSFQDPDGGLFGVFVTIKIVKEK